MIIVKTILEYKDNTVIKKTIVLLIGIPIYISINKCPMNEVKEEVVKPKRIGFQYEIKD